ncbi:3-phosphoserine/phosphohydroxythreonine transaminase [Panacibacter ginsenosidivorans]|uniref:Phosphoserine aminotransferase n=1 Tax=Panacibacter ginsenosidivorans TaxID=1813871 RepID=A0A5B8V8J4_9BACT|nr:3-phosphoserine/phosphohydroxythreonine transaminase [Panacibacter ginsenosidivorans]QEC67860.1 3-phosphoserine/phosphohydroxythreonine transaminase [Panacibacter ginsenosidivorans]
MKMHNFNSGPSILPDEVMEQAAAAIHDFNGIGLSILEIGHRTSWFGDVMTEARSLVKELMNIGNEHEVLFLHGGASTQFMQVPMNLLDSNETAAYVDNGIWGTKAVKEAKLFGNAIVVSSTKDRNHSYIAKDFSIPADAKYLHFTTNNTVEGTEWHHIPETNVPLVADMSSDIFSRPFDYSKFALIYAGAQKNMGAAGVNIVVVRKDILGIKRAIPAIMDYRNHIEAGSLLNTPPVFAVYVALLTMRWIKKEGGLVEMGKRAKERADLFYNTLNALPAFRPLVVEEDRSFMNATFTTAKPEMEDVFLGLCKQNGMVGVKGHRSVGGLRVSMYNALPLSSVQAITDLMKDFSEKHA